MEAFDDHFEELDHQDDLWNVSTRPTYLQEAVDTDLFREICKKILPAKAEEIARVFSTVIPRDQVDTELCSKESYTIFEERKDTTLSSKLVKTDTAIAKSGVSSPSGKGLELKKLPGNLFSAFVLPEGRLKSVLLMA